MVKNIKKIIGILCSAAFCTTIAVGIPQIANAAEVTINSANFPDKIFREYVSNEFDKDNNGKLSNREITEVTEISVSGSRYSYEEDLIKSLKGVEYFTSLTALYCDGNKLKELDVSSNILLKTLNCGNNNLTELDISNNIALEDLECGNSALHPEWYYVENEIKKLDLSQNTELKYLYCYYNQLTDLDISHNTDLILLSCSGNKLTNLDLSQNTKLTELFCDNNQLTELNVSYNTALTRLSCGGNNITKLDLSQNTELTELFCGYGQCHLEELKLHSQTYNKLSLYKGPLHSYDAKLSNLKNVTETKLNEDEENKLFIKFKYDCMSLIKVLDITKPATYKVNGKDFTIIYADTAVMPSASPAVPSDTNIFIDYNNTPTVTPTMTPVPENTSSPDGLSTIQKNKLLLEQIKVAENMSIKEGSSKKLNFTLPYGVTVVDTFTGRDGEVKVSYYSSDRGVATVNHNGDIKAKKKGTVDITTVITFENRIAKGFITKVKVNQNKKSNSVVVTKKNMKKLCNDLCSWLGIQVVYKINPGKKVIYTMSKNTRRDIITHVPDYIELHVSEAMDYYPDYNDKWDKLSQKLFGKKTSGMQKPFLGEWGDDGPFIKNIKVKTNGKKQYKVKADVLFYDDSDKGSVVINLKKNNKSSYGAAITKITVKHI